MNEAQTRKEIIDKELVKRDWQIDNPFKVIVEFQMEKILQPQLKVVEPTVAYGSKVTLYLPWISTAC